MNGYRLPDYVKDVQLSLIPFAVDDEQSVSIKDHVDKATFLIFELLELSPRKRRIFKAHISNDLLLPDLNSFGALEVYNRKLKRLFDNDSSFYSDLKTKGYLPKGIELPEGWQEWTAPKIARKVLDRLLTKYKNTPISPNLGTTAVVYQAWKQGIFHDFWQAGRRKKKFTDLIDLVRGTLFSDNHSVSDEKKLIELLNEMARRFSLKATDLTNGKTKIAQVNANCSFDGKNGEAWALSTNDKDFFSIELSLIHKIHYAIYQGSNGKRKANDKKYYLVHYPLVLDNYWFTGFGYYLAEKSIDTNKAELFEINKYYKFLDLLNETFGIPLKNALRSRVLNNVDWKEPITVGMLLHFLRQYFACFDFREIASKARTSIRNKGIVYDVKKFQKKIADKKPFRLRELEDVKIAVSVPVWVEDNYQEQLKAEITSFLQEINRLKNDAESIKEITEKHGSRASGVSIMSRNLSHNDGSHVISHWNSEIGKILEQDKKLEFPRALLKSKALFQYLQHRMDFLAEVSTSVPCSEMSLNVDIDILKPAFTDPLAGEKIGALDHPDHRLHRSVLLEYIARSEALNLHHKIEVIVDQFKRVSIPNGLVGNHAIYSILENFLRNAAKHYIGTVIDEKEDLSVAHSKCKKAIESVMAYYKLLKTENSKKLNNERAFPLECKIACVDNCNDIDQCRFAINILHEYQNKENSIPIMRIEITEPEVIAYRDRYLAMTIWDMRENSCNHRIIADLRKYLPESESDDRLLSKNGELQTDGWGIKEMLISANFLRKNSADELYEIIKTQGRENKPPLIEILCVNNGSDKQNGCRGLMDCKRNDLPYSGRLGWRFYLLKPKDLVIAGDREIKGNIGNNFEINVKKIDQQLQEELPYRMLLLSRGKSETYKDDPYAPCRIRENNISPNEGKPSEYFDNSYLQCYEEFIKETIMRNEELPKVIFTGAGAPGYNDLFNGELTKPYGKAVIIEDFIVNGTEKTVIFYHHAQSNFKDIELADWEGFITSHNGLYFQDLSGGHSFNLRVNNEGVTGMSPLHKKHLLLELIESAMTKVLIIDERVSIWADKAWTNKIPLRKKLEKMNIIALDVNLEEITYADLSVKLSQLPIKDPHFLVVHQGILEKIKKIDEANVKRLFDHEVVKKCLWKIVDSGRGVQKEKLEKYQDYKVRFVEISSLLKMLDNFDKHALVQTLFATRNPIKKQQGDR